MPGGERLFEPGSQVDVEVVANANGNVATRGDLVQITGENRGRTQVALVDTRGAGVGHLVETPADYDPDAVYAAGDVVGHSSVYTRNPIDKLYDGGNTFAPGDQVVSAVGGGVRAYGGTGDTLDMIMGRVWKTGLDDASDKVAVLRFK